MCKENNKKEAASNKTLYVATSPKFSQPLSINLTLCVKTVNRLDHHQYQVHQTPHHAHPSRSH